MKNYDEYIGKMKAFAPSPDYQQMRFGIERRAAQRAIFLPIQISLGVTSSLAIIFISLALYFNLAQNTNDLGLNYVMEQEQINGNMVVSYIFAD